MEKLRPAEHLHMSEAINRIVDAYVKLRNRKALEDLKATVTA